MKRSEAIENIKEIIEVNLDNLQVIPDATLVAELILYHLEQKGMLPPRAPIPGTSLSDNYWEK